jgi:hypothetical protein
MSKGSSVFNTSPWFNRDRQQYRPVNNAYRVGVQTDDGVLASVNRLPSRANRSIAGV